MSNPCKGMWFLLFFAVFVSLAERALCNNFVGDGLLQTDLSRVSEIEASEIIEGLERDNLNSDRALEALEKDLAQLRDEQDAIETETKTLVAERQKEAQKKEDRDAELLKAKAAIQEREASISMMTVRETELRGELASLESNLAKLEREKDETEEMYTDPSILQVLSLRAHQWDSVPRNVFNKTMRNIVPALSGLPHVPSQISNKISKTSPALGLLASLLIYGLCCCFMLVAWRAYRRALGKLTISRMIFLSDVASAMFWSMVIVCHSILLTDPLHAIQERSPAFFFVFQMLALFGYFGAIFLRVVVLSCKLSLQSLGETLAVTVVGQHYYVRVWRPAVVDYQVRGALFYYICYVAIFGAFATSRMARSLPHKQRDSPRTMQDYVNILRQSLLR